jgi:hypothetical protein
MNDLVDSRGWYKTYRQLDEWEWYRDSRMVHLFIHFLNKANYTDKEWRGILIKRGQFVTGRYQLSAETGIPVGVIRGCLKKFKKTNEILTKITNQFTIITVCNYERYQDINSFTNQPLTNDSPSTNHQLTTTKKVKKERIKESVFTLPEKIDPSLWVAFEEMRKSIKAPLTDHAKKLIVDKLMRLDDSNGSLRQSIENTWRGVFPVKEQFKKENSEFI